MHLFLVTRFISFVFIICLQISIIAFAAWSFTALPVNSGDLGVIEPLLVIVGALTAFFLPPIMLADLSRRHALPSQAWFELTWTGAVWVFDLAGGLRLALDADYFACDPTPLVPEVTFQGCTAPKILLGLVWAVDFLFLFHFVAILVLTLRTPRLPEHPHPLFLAISQNPLLQPPMPSFSPVASPVPSEKFVASSPRRKLQRRRASEQLTLNDGDIDIGFFGNDSADSEESVGPSMREIVAEEALGVKNAGGRKRTSSLPAMKRPRIPSGAPPVPSLPAGVRTSMAQVPVRQRQISAPYPLAPHQVNMDLMPLPQSSASYRQHQSHPPQPINPQPYYVQDLQSSPRQRTYSGSQFVATPYAPAEDRPRHMRSSTMPIPGSSILSTFRYDYNPALVPPTPQTPQLPYNVQQLYRFPVSPAKPADAPLVPTLEERRRTNSSFTAPSSRSRSRSRRPSRAAPPTEPPLAESNPRQTIQISAPLTSMPSFPEAATRRMSQRPSHMPKRLTVPGPLAPEPAVWPAPGASRDIAGLAYPEPAAVVARRMTKSEPPADDLAPTSARKGYTRPSMLLGIANPSPSPPPGPATPSVYAPSPEPILPYDSPAGQQSQAPRRPRKDSLKSQDYTKKKQTGAQLYAHYMTERYSTAV